MDVLTTFSVSEVSPYIWVAAALAAILYYTSLPQAAVYGNFPRAGGTILRWTPVHEIVASGYKKVTNIHIVLSIKYKVSFSAADNQGIQEADCGTMVVERLPDHATAIPRRPANGELDRPALLPKH
jgi:hypothetical protein